MAVLVVNLKGVYKHPGWDDMYHFIEWAKRTNNVEISGWVHEQFKVSVSIKEGKRRKLKRKLATIYNAMPCDCCGPLYRVRFE